MYRFVTYGPFCHAPFCDVLFCNVSFRNVPLCTVLYFCNIPFCKVFWWHDFYERQLSKISYFSTAFFLINALRSEANLSSFWIIDLFSEKSLSVKRDFLKFLTIKNESSNKEAERNIFSRLVSGSQSLSKKPE